MTDVDRLAEELWADALPGEQRSRVIPDDPLAAPTRSRVRRLAAADCVEVRTDRLDEAIIVVRLDAKLRVETSGTMGEQLTLPAHNA